MDDVRVLVDGLGFPESLRWRDGRVWLANWGSGEVLAILPGAPPELVTQVDARTIPFSIDWRSDGRLLLVDGPRRQLLAGEPATPLRSSRISPGSVRRRSMNSSPTPPATPM